MGNSNLHIAKKEKNDEFYTQLTDIENELKHYRNHFAGKTVYCNCDDCFESNFFRYFALNFNFLGLKKLIATCYAESKVADFGIFGKVILEESEKKAYKIEINEAKDFNSDGRFDLTDIVESLTSNTNNHLSILNGNGSYDSEECIALLKESDIVVTNPPFSLFRDYVATLVKYDKKFIILGNKNAITYKEIFPLIKDNKMWLGYYSPCEFRQPDGTITKQVSGLCRWFTNLTHKKRNEELILYKKYTKKEYPKYDNYDAINVDKVTDIPYDYDGVMGVPITFLDKYNPNQFEIVGFFNSYNPETADITRGQIYGNAVKVDSTTSLFRGPVIKGKAKYFRILIKRKDN